MADEADLGLGEKQHVIYRAFPNALFVGVTATPYFDPLEGLTNRGLVQADERWTRMFTDCIHEMTLEEAMERQILTPLDVTLIKTGVSVQNIEISSDGDYKQSDLERYLAIKARDVLILGMLAGVDKMPPTVHISDEQRKQIALIHEKIQGKRTAIFGISIDHINNLAQELKKLGVAAEAVHSELDPDKRRDILEAHKRGNTPVVLGIDILGRGWDSPATEVGIYARPTHSGVVKVQQLGRILRQSKYTGKTEAIAIELVDQFPRQASEVLIAHIFDPEYVLRGSQSGRTPSLSKGGSLKKKRL